MEVFLVTMAIAFKIKSMYCTEGGVRVCGIAVLGYFWCGVAVIFISKYGIAVFRVHTVCGKFKFHVAVVGEKILVSRWSASFSWNVRGFYGRASPFVCAVLTSPQKGETAVYGYDPALVLVLSVSCWCLAKLIFTLYDQLCRIHCVYPLYWCLE